MAGGPAAAPAAPAEPPEPVSGPARRGPARGGLPGERGRPGDYRWHHACWGKLSCSSRRTIRYGSFRL